jgi:hypothetical protein
MTVYKVQGRPSALHVFVEPGKLEDVGEALAKMPEIIDTMCRGLMGLNFPTVLVWRLLQQVGGIKTAEVRRDA